ncbi:MAG: helix-turn-helix domain-containing protein [Polyangiaceae bacterium]
MRRYGGWTQQQLADRLRIDVSAMQRLERGTHACTLDTLGRLAKALKCQPIQLLVPPGEASESRSGRPRKNAVAQESTIVWAVVPRLTR